MEKINGIVEAINSKNRSGIKVNGKWYNATPETAALVAKVEKGDVVNLEVDGSAINAIRMAEGALPVTPPNQLMHKSFLFNMLMDNPESIDQIINAFCFGKNVQNVITTSFDNADAPMLLKTILFRAV